MNTSIGCCDPNQDLGRDKAQAICDQLIMNCSPDEAISIFTNLKALLCSYYNKEAEDGMAKHDIFKEYQSRLQAV